MEGGNMGELALARLGGGSELRLISTFTTGTMTIVKSGMIYNQIAKSGNEWFTPDLSDLAEVMLEIRSNFSGTISEVSFNLSLGASGYGNQFNPGIVLVNSSGPQVSGQYSGQIESLARGVSNGVVQMYVPLGIFSSAGATALQVCELGTSFGDIGYQVAAGGINGTINVTGSVTIQMFGRKR